MSLDHKYILKIDKLINELNYIKKEYFYEYHENKLNLIDRVGEQLMFSLSDIGLFIEKLYLYKDYFMRVSYIFHEYKDISYFNEEYKIVFNDLLKDLCNSQKKYIFTEIDVNSFILMIDNIGFFKKVSQIYQTMLSKKIDFDLIWQDWDMNLKSTDTDSLEMAKKYLSLCFDERNIISDFAYNNDFSYSLLFFINISRIYTNMIEFLDIVCDFLEL